MATILLRNLNPVVLLHNVGAGVTDPDQALEVGGIIHISEEQGSTPSAPSNGDGGLLYTKANGKLYWRSNDVSESDLTAASTIGSGGANKIAIWSDGDTIFADTDLHWDSTNNRLGMGTTPSTNLHIEGAVNDATSIGGIIRNTDAGVLALSRFSLGNNTTERGLDIQYVNGNHGTYPNDGLILNQHSTGKIHIGNGNIGPALTVAADNKIGIGTGSTTLTKILHVSSEAHDGGVLIDAANNNQSTQLGITAKTSAGVKQNYYFDVSRSSKSFNIVDGTAGTTRLVIDDDGKVQALGGELQVKKDQSSVIFNVHADTDSSSVPAIELQRGANDTWGADGYTDYRIKGTGGNLVIENASGGNAAVERLQVLEAGGVKINGAYTLPTAVTSTNDYVLTAQTNGTTAWAAGGGGGSVAGISTSADATAITITAAERVGVGSGGAQAPDSLFHVDDASDTFDQGGMKVRIHSEVAASDKYAGIGFGIDTGGRLMKSAIVHKRTGGNGQGELLFCVDSSTDGNDVSTADEVMKLTNAGHVVLNTSKLPTSDPSVAGALYSNGGVLTVSAG